MRTITTRNTCPISLLASTKAHSQYQRLLARYSTPLVLVSEFPFPSVILPIPSASRERHRSYTRSALPHYKSGVFAEVLRPKQRSESFKEGEGELQAMACGGQWVRSSQSDCAQTAEQWRFREVEDVSLMTEGDQYVRLPMKQILF